MRCAYDCQNALGRLCDERVYENDLARRLRSEGFREVHSQVPITMSHGRFHKEYRLDLLADDALYELKTVTAFTSEHDAQILHYAMLLSVNHGKLLNFRNMSVEGRLRCNAVLTETRQCVTCDATRWQPLSLHCADLMQHTKAILHDWGSFLDFRLYEEALVFHFGGEGHASIRSPLTLDGIQLGTHRFCLHDTITSFMVTGFSDAESQRSHVQRLLKFSGFNAMQWLNFHHSSVRFTTLTR